MSNTGDIRYGESPFPYGDMYDRGISLDKIVGVAEDPRGLTEGTTYVAITLHKNYAEYAASSPVDGERTIYIAASLFGNAEAVGSELVTIRLGESFHYTGAAYIAGQVAGVVSVKGLIGLFSWRVSNGTLEWFPDSALTVFDDVVTPESINGTTWGGADAYSAATAGAPLYYFLWDAASERLDGPVRRVLPEVSTGEVAYAHNAYGVFVPVSELGVPLDPIPAVIRGWDITFQPGCIGYISQLETQFTSEAADVAVGSAALADESAWGAPGGSSTSSVPSTGVAAPATFEYGTSFPNAYTDGYLSGYFFRGWYDPGLALDAALQNQDKTFLSGEAELSSVYMLDADLSFMGGTAETPNKLFLNLTPADGQLPSSTATLEFTIAATEETSNGSASALLAIAYTGTGGSTAVFCYGSFYVSMWVNYYSIKKIEYNTLASGSAEGQVLVWDNTLGEWEAGSPSALPNGSNNGQLLMWDATGATPAWVAGPYGTETGQILEWDGTAWVPGDGGILPDGTNNGQLLVWDATGATPAWVAGPYGTETGQVLQWSGTGWTAGAGGAGEGHRSIELDEVTGKLQLVGDEDTLAAGVFYGGHPITGVRGFQVGAAKTFVTGVRYNSTTHTFQVQLCDCVVVSAGDNQDWVNITGGTCAPGAGAVIAGTTAHYHS